MPWFKAFLLVLLQTHLCTSILSITDVPCAPPQTNVPALFVERNYSSGLTNWIPTFCGDWRDDFNHDGICIRTWCDRQSEDPLDEQALKEVLGDGFEYIFYQTMSDPFKEQIWSARDSTGRLGAVLRIKGSDRRPGLLKNGQVQTALLELRRYWSGAPYEQTDFVIFHDGFGVIGGGDARKYLPGGQNNATASALEETS